MSNVSLRTIGDAPTVWFTGLSGAGKTTIARKVAQMLSEVGIAHVVLDGDDLRATLSADLGFSPEDRAEQVRRAAHLARISTDAGLVALVALVSPFRADRSAARAVHGSRRFMEVYVATPLSVCERRDTKGLYSQSMQGHGHELTGIGQPYEAPDEADIVVDGSYEWNVDVLARRVFDRMRL